MAFLKVCIQGGFDGFGRMDNAMNPKNLSCNPLIRPLAIPPYLRMGCWAAFSPLTSHLLLADGLLGGD